MVVSMCGLARHDQGWMELLEVVHRWQKWCLVGIVRATETRSVSLTTSVSRGFSQGRPMHGKAGSIRGWRALLCHDEYAERERALNQVLINELHRTAAGVSAHWGIAVDDVLCGAARAMHPHVRGDEGFFEGDVPPLKRCTPTCVGTTTRPCLAGAAPRVHPHVRGDNTMIRRGKRGLEGSIVPFRLRDGQITHCSVVPGIEPFAAGRRLYQPEAGSSAGHRRVAPRRTGREPRTVAAGHPIGGRRWRSLREGPLSGGERPDCPFRRRPDAAAMAGYPARSCCGATGCGPARAVLVGRVAPVPLAPTACSRGMRRQTAVG